MKSVKIVAVVAVLLACASTTFAARPGSGMLWHANGLNVPGGIYLNLSQLGQSGPAFAQIQPVPMQAPQGYAPQPMMAAPAMGGGLYPNVCYKDEHKIAPCAVPTVVSIKDPCDDRCDPCNVKCVNVAICVPPCTCPPKVHCNKDGSRVTYDFGKYEVHLTSKKGVVKVDYNN